MCVAGAPRPRHGWGGDLQADADREPGGGGRHLPARPLPRHLLVPPLLQDRQTAQAGPREVMCVNVSLSHPMLAAIYQKNNIKTFEEIRTAIDFYRNRKPAQNFLCFVFPSVSERDIK